MINKEVAKNREQVHMVSMSELVPKDHILRIIDKAIDWTFIYDLVEDKYSKDKGRPSIDPVTLIKIPFIQYLFGIKSMRQTCKEIEVNVAYRWFLGLDMYDKVPHFSTFGKNYSRRFAGTDLFEQIFEHILKECYKYKFINPSEVYVDATHVKARANSRKMKNRIAKKEALFYKDILRKEIDEDRLLHGKKKLKDKVSEEDINKDNHNNNDDDNDDGTPSVKSDKNEFSNDIPKDYKNEKVSTVDPESGWFRKGEHKHVFAYSVQTACDENGWILGYDINPANLHDSRTFKGLYDKLDKENIDVLIADAGYKTPAIAKLIMDDSIKALFPYKRPMTKKGFFVKREYVYDEYHDEYICPNHEILKYSTTNRDGYREYKSDNRKCIHCPYLEKCTLSKNHTKVVTRHIWEDYIERCEDLRGNVNYSV